MDEQICGLRTMERGLLERWEQAGARADVASLGVAYSVATARLDALVQFCRKSEQGWIERVVARAWRICWRSAG